MPREDREGGTRIIIIYILRQIFLRLIKLLDLMVNVLVWIEWLNWSSYILIIMLLRVFEIFNQAMEVISIVKSIHVELGFETLTNEKWIDAIDYSVMN